VSFYRRIRRHGRKTCQHHTPLSQTALRHMLKKFSYITDQLKIPETHAEMFENSFNYPHLSDILGRDQGKRRS